MKTRKGIILAGGSGTRLYPITHGVSKQLLPIYDKPMIYYPLTTLMLAGIRDILIISTPIDLPQYERVLRDGRQWGLSVRYKVQPNPEGIAQAFILAEEFLKGSPSALILGDNIFYGHGLPQTLLEASKKDGGASIFGYHVTDPQRYGVVGFDSNGQVNSIIEKPERPLSNYAVTGLYFLDETAPERTKNIKPSERGKQEITSLLNVYLAESILKVEKLSWGYAWLDTGTHASLLDAGNFVRTLIERQGLQVGSPEEVAYKAGWITKSLLSDLAESYGKNKYGEYLMALSKL